MTPANVVEPDALTAYKLANGLLSPNTLRIPNASRTFEAATSLSTLRTCSRKALAIASGSLSVRTTRYWLF